MKNHIEAEFTKYEFAKLSFQECLEYLDLYEKYIRTFYNDEWVFTRSLSKSYVITYSRPFTSNNPVRGFGGGSIATKWLTKLSKELQDLHHFIVDRGRNSLVAHVDISELMPNIFIKENHNDYVFDWPIPMLEIEKNKLFKELATRAYEYCVEHQEKIKPKLETDHIIPVRIIRSKPPGK